MSKTADTDNAKPVEESKPRSFVKGFLESVNPGYAVAGASALWSGSILAIEKNLNDLLKMNGRLETLNQASADGFKNVYPAWTKVRSDELDWDRLYPDWKTTEDPLKKPPEWAKNFSPEELQKRQHAIDTELQNPGRITAWNNDIRKARLEQDGINNVMQKFKRLRPYQKQLVVANFLTVFAIGVGALYSYSANRGLAEKLHEERAKNTQQQER